MARASWSSSNILRLSSALVSGPPLTIAGWLWTSITNANQVAAGVIQAAGTTATRNLLGLRTNGTQQIGACSSAAGTIVQAQSSTTYPASRWFHGAAVFASTTSRAAYLNAGGKGTNTTSNSPASLDRTSFGSADDTNNAWVWGSGGTGYIAKLGFWNIALGDDDVFLLAQGVDPRLIKPWALLAYIPILGFGNPEMDLSGKQNHFSVIGSPTFAPEEPPFPNFTDLESIATDHAIGTSGTPTIINFTNGSFPFTGNPFTLNASTIATIQKASFTFTGRPLTVDAAVKIAMTAASYSFTGRQFATNVAMLIALGRGHLTYTGQPFTASVSGASGRRINKLALWLGLELT